MKFTHQEKVNSGDEKLGIFLNRHPLKFSWYQIPLYPLALREITEQLKWKPVLGKLGEGGGGSSYKKKHHVE